MLGQRRRRWAIIETDNIGWKSLVCRNAYPSGSASMYVASPLGNIHVHIHVKKPLLTAAWLWPKNNRCAHYITGGGGDCYLFFFSFFLLYFYLFWRWTSNYFFMFVEERKYHILSRMPSLFCTLLFAGLLWIYFPLIPSTNFFSENLLFIFISYTPPPPDI